MNSTSPIKHIKTANSNKVYLGIDQTGAVDSKGNPKPLPSCSITGAKIDLFYLAKLSPKNIKTEITADSKTEILICIDCVLGLPTALNLSWREVLRKVKKNKAYGRDSARMFFKTIGRSQVWTREIEKQLKANSVFKEKPFQKNIQTGTFRLWRDIADSYDDFYVPSLEKKKSKNQIPLFEGYPTYSWKLLFGVKKRSPEKVLELLKNKDFNLNWTKKHQQMADRDPNLADAFVLALTAKLFAEKALLQPAAEEGRILGFNSND